MSTRISTSLAAAAGLVLASVAFTGTAAAQGEATLIPCFGDQNVPPGNYDLFVSGWATGPRGALKHFIKSQTTEVTVQFGDDPAVTLDLTDDFGPPQPFDAGPGPKAWNTELVLPLGELVAGQSITVSVVTTLTEPIVDFFHRPTPVDPSNLKAGDQPITGSCTITVT